MTKAVLIQAPAKINLHLAIGGPRKDGFHSLLSIFQAISLYDEIELSLNDTGEVSLDCEVDCPPEKNTVYRAASLCLNHARSRGLAAITGIHIRVSKKIPAGAGLGGGSSDAAAVIKALASLQPALYTKSSMMSIAAEVGSDVPFFLGTACALVGGRGERLEELGSRTDYSLVLVYPGVSIQTGLAFRTLDAYREESGFQTKMDDEALWSPEGRSSLSTAYLAGIPDSWPFRNDFFDALVPAYPVLARVQRQMLDCGASFASLSGSGSTVFGIFKTTWARERAVAGLNKAGFLPIRAFPLARLPELD